MDTMHINIEQALLRELSLSSTERKTQSNKERYAHKKISKFKKKDFKIQKEYKKMIILAYRKMSK